MGSYVPYIALFDIFYFKGTSELMECEMPKVI
jgi:hypothetical protein